MKKNTSVRVIALIGMCLLIQSAFPLLASAQETKAEDRGSLPLKKQRGPVVITGDNLTVDSANKIATYTCNVKVVQGTTSMFSDELMIYLDSTGKKLAKAVAKGNLRLVNESINILKDTSIMYFIGVVDLMGRAGLIINAHYGQGKLETYCAVALIYWALVILVEIAFHMFQKWSSPKERSAV